MLGGQSLTLARWRGGGASTDWRPISFGVLGSRRLPVWTGLQVGGAVLDTSRILLQAVVGNPHQNQRRAEHL